MATQTYPAGPSNQQYPSYMPPLTPLPQRQGSQSFNGTMFQFAKPSPQHLQQLQQQQLQQQTQDDGEDEIDQLDDEVSSEDDDPDVFKIRNELDLPTRTEYTTKELHAFIHQSEIDLSPPYQRDIIWPRSKQVQLIHSLFHNYYIPPVVLAQVVDEDETIKRCVDGKQRLTSIQNFIDGLIPYRDGKKEWYYVALDDGTRGAANRTEIPIEYRERFDQIKIQCAEYTALSAIAEREIFQRVQLGVPLSAAERLQAIASPLAEWISGLPVRHIDIDNGLKSLLKVDTSRGRDFQNIASLVYCCDRRDKKPTPSAKGLESWLNQSTPPSSHMRKAVEDSLSAMTWLANDARYNEGFRKIGKRVAPVEFIFIGVLLFVTEGLEDAKRAKAILNLRKTVRKEHTDIRTNTKCCKTLWRFIDSYDEASGSRKRNEREADSEFVLPSQSSSGRRIKPRRG